MVTHYQDIFPNHEHAPSRFYAVQGESGTRKVVFNLHDAHGAAVNVSGSRALLYVIKPDRNVAIIECEIGSGEGGSTSNQISCVLTLQAAACPGVCSMILQVLTDDGDLRYENMELLVSPAEGIEGLVSRTDLGPLAQIIASGRKITATLSETKEVSTLLKGILTEYFGNVSAETRGVITRADQADNDRPGTVTFDTEGNLLWLDKYNYGARDSKLSLNNGATWVNVPLQESESEEQVIFDTCVGGEKFLCLSKRKFCWAEVVGEGLVVGPMLANPFYNTSSMTVFNTRYVQGKYFVFPRAGATHIIDDTAYSPGYFTGNEAECVMISLPDQTMIAQDIVFDPESGAYYMTGKWANGSSNYHKRWLLKTADLATWETVRIWDGERDQLMTLTNGIISIYPLELGLFTLYRYEIATGDFSTVTIPTDSEFYIVNAVTGAIGAVVINSRRELAFTKDGISFEMIPFSWEGEVPLAESIAMYGRRVIISVAEEYIVFRLDIAGEGTLKQMTALMSEVDTWFSETREQLQDQIGRQIIITNVDPGEGADVSPGSVIFVYGGGAAVLWEG